MRYPREHKQEARRRLVANSARHVKKHGFAASGVDALAASAGVTSGSFYKHFGDKAALFTAVIEADMQRTLDLYASIDAEDETAAEAALFSYLGPEHLGHADLGCPLPALAPEVARADPATRRAFDEGLRRIQGRLEGLTGSGEAAWALLAQTVGAVMLARAALDPALRQELLAAARVESLVILKRDRGHRRACRRS